MLSVQGADGQQTEETATAYGPGPIYTPQVSVYLLFCTCSLAMIGCLSMFASDMCSSQEVSFNSSQGHWPYLLVLHTRWLLTHSLTANTTYINPKP